jgi:glycosyltransferase involved in cell wall biosynthesis
MEKLPRFSIIMPSLNSSRFIHRSIEAFLEQDYPNKRLIIVDGKSTDSTHEIISDYLASHREVEWLKQVDNGISDAINIALQKLDDNEFYGFLGADDLLLQGTFQKAAIYLNQEPNAVGVFFDSFSQNAQGDRKFRKCPSSTMALKHLLRHRAVAGMQNFYVRASVAKRYGFNPKTRYAMDYEFCLRLAADGLGEAMHHISHASTININDGNISTKFRRASRHEALGLAYAAAPSSLRKWILKMKLWRARPTDG